MLSCKLVNVRRLLVTIDQAVFEIHGVSLSLRVHEIAKTATNDCQLEGLDGYTMQLELQELEEYERSLLNRLQHKYKIVYSLWVQAISYM